MTSICFIANHGVAADPIFEWLPRALASHRDLFVYLGEGVRAKYFGERGRQERPDIGQYEAFLADVAGSYKCAVECYAYRAFTIDSHEFNLKSTKVVNVIRNPLIWLSYYTKWRVNNLNQPEGITSALEHEWRVIDHEELMSADLNYERKDVGRWSFFRGIQILNKMVSDSKLRCRNFPLESLYDSYDDFSAFLSFLSDGEISIGLDTFELSKGYEYQRNLESTRYTEAESIISNYEPWQLHALEKYWSKESRYFFETCGYTCEIK